MIRQATLEDLHGLVEVSWQVQQLHRAARPARYRDTPRRELVDRFRALLAAPGRSILVVDVADEVLGYAVVRRIDNPGDLHALPRVSAHVDDLGVREHARRAGHGRALMAAVEDLARAWGTVVVSLDVQAFNRDAVAFYEALGYSFSSHRMSKPIPTTESD